MPYPSRLLPVLLASIALGCRSTERAGPSPAAEPAATSTDVAPEPGAPPVVSGPAVQAPGEPADGASGAPAELSPAARRVLRDLAAEWFAAEQAYELAEDAGERRSRRVTRDRTERRFMLGWRAFAEPCDVLARPEELRAIFDSAFPHEERRPTDGLEVRRAPRGTGYGLWVPAGDAPDAKLPAVVCLPGRNETGWVAPAEHFAATWSGTSLAARSLVVVPEVRAELDLDAAGRELVDHEETRRLMTVLYPLGEVQRRYRVDRDRVVLDCGRGSCAFGLRIASHFASRFAGIVLRDPVVPEGARLDGLAGLPVLLLQTATTQDACAELKRRLDALAPGACTVLVSPGGYPHGEQAAPIARWIDSVARDLTRPRVVVAPTDWRFRKAYWVELVGSSEPPAGPTALEAVADRASNRITVTARNVPGFRLRLNDALVDLDREVRIVVNGVEKVARPRRDLLRMVRLMRERYDAHYLFPAEYVATGPF